MKCLVVKRAHHTIRNRLYKYFTYKNTLRYIEVLPKFVGAYNDTVHSTTGMTLSRVTDLNVLAVWKRMNHRRICVAKVKLSFEQHVRISKEKMKFAKGGEHNFSTEVFRITATNRLRAGGFKPAADRGTILRGGTHTCLNLKSDHLQER